MTTTRITYSESKFMNKALLIGGAIFTIFLGFFVYYMINHLDFNDENSELSLYIPLGLLFIVIFGLVFLIVRKIFIKGSITLLESSILIELDKTNSLYQNKTIEIPFSNLISYSTVAFNGEPSIKFRHSGNSSRININYINKEPYKTEFKDFSAEFSKRIEEFNLSKVSNEEKITDDTIFSKPWAKWVTIFTLILFIALSIVIFTEDEVSWSGSIKIAMIFSVLMPFWISVYKAQFKKTPRKKNSE